MHLTGETKFFIGVAVVTVVILVVTTALRAITGTIIKHTMLQCITQLAIPAALTIGNR